MCRAPQENGVRANGVSLLTGTTKSQFSRIRGYPKFVTGFWKIGLNVTFYYSNIYNQNKEWELPITLKVATMCSSHLELPENNWKYFEKLCNPFAVVTINCVILCISM